MRSSFCLWMFLASGALAQPATGPSTRPTPTAEQRAIVAADDRVPADEPAVKIDRAPFNADGSANPNFGKPQERFLEMHRTFLARRLAPADVVFLGDSITQGWRSNGKDVWEKRIAEKYRAANFGIGGDRTQHVLWRLEQGELDGMSPKLVVLMIGTNNISAYTPEQINFGIRRVVAVIREKVPNAKVLVLGLLPRSKTASDAAGQPDRFRAGVTRVNEQLASIDDGGSVRFLRIWNEFLMPDGEIREPLMHDFLHPSPEGYVVFAEAMLPMIDAMLAQ